MPLLKTPIVALNLSPFVEDPSLPADPNLQKLTDSILAKLKYSFAVVAAETQPTAHGRLDEMSRTFLATRAATSRGRYRDQSQALLASPQLRAMHFQRYAAVTPEEYQKLGSDHVEPKAAPLGVQAAALQESLTKLVAKHSLVPETHPAFINLGPIGPGLADLKAGMAFTKMRLFLRSVKCVEETDEIGSDDINMGGIYVDPFGNTTKIGEFGVSDDFDQGEIVKYGTSKALATWNLVTDAHGFPYVYNAVLAMAEKDDGGFYKFLQDLWSKVKEEALALIGAGVGLAVGGAIGNVLGAIVGAAVGAFIGWVIGLVNNSDDIVDKKVLKMTLGTCTKSYYDWAKLTTPDGWVTTLHFKGDGGRYDVELGYKVFTQ